MKYRLASVDDLRGLTSLNQGLFAYERQFTDTFASDWPESEDGQRYFRGQIASELLYMAEDDGEIVGYVCCSLSSPSYRSKQPILEIDNIFVAEAYRGQGVGRRLMDWVEELARSKLCQRIRVEGLYDNARAMRFYEECGFDRFELILEKPIDY